MKSKTYLFVQMVKRTFVYCVCHSYVTDLKVIIKMQERVNGYFLTFILSTSLCSHAKIGLWNKFFTDIYIYVYSSRHFFVQNCQKLQRETFLLPTLDFPRMTREWLINSGSKWVAQKFDTEASPFLKIFWEINKRPIVLNQILTTKLLQIICKQLLTFCTENNL